MRRMTSRRTLFVLAAAAGVGLAATVVAVSPMSAGSAQAATGCGVTYTANAWTGGFTATVKLTAGSTALSGWTLAWTYPGDQKVTNGWNATVTQTGQKISAVNAAFNGSVAAGASVEFGVQGTYTSNNTAPTDFVVNGEACNGGAPSSPSASPSPSTSTSPPPAGTGCTSAAFCDGLENQTSTTPSGSWTVTAADCTGTGTAVIDSSTAHAGSKSLKINGGGGYCNHVFAKATPSVGAVRYTRFYVRHTTALPSGHVTFVAMQDANDGNKDLRIGGQNAALQWNRASDDATLPEQSPTGVSMSVPLATNTWSCLEFLVDGTHGYAQTWVNGTEVAGLHVDGTPTHDVDSQWLNKTWRPSLTDLRLGWESYGGDTDTLWFDDIAVSSSRIGC
jgi:hypothetical protein